MQLVQPCELLHGPVVVVDAQIDDGVGQAAVSAAPFDDEERRFPAFPCSATRYTLRPDDGSLLQRPRNVHLVDIAAVLAGERVEEPDRVLASVSGEMAAVVIDHPDTRSQIAREFEGGDAGTKRGGSSAVA